MPATRSAERAQLPSSPVVKVLAAVVPSANAEPAAGLTESSTPLSGTFEPSGASPVLLMVNFVRASVTETPMPPSPERTLKPSEAATTLSWPSLPTLTVMEPSALAKPAGALDSATV